MENLTTSPATQPAVHAQPLQKDVRVDDRTIKRIAAGALRQVDGVLGFGASVADLFKSGGDDDIAGIDVTADSGSMVSVYAKIITEYGKNIPQIVAFANSHLATAISGVAGITLEKLEIEVVDTMTPEEYKQALARHNGLA